MSAQRAKVMKFKDGYMISTGEPKNQYSTVAKRNVLMKQGVMGLQVKIMLPHDPTGKAGVKMALPDDITIFEPKEEETPIMQSAEDYGLTKTFFP